jgi:hypothetical protein
MQSTCLIAQITRNHRSISFSESPGTVYSQGGKPCCQIRHTMQKLRTQVAQLKIKKKYTVRTIFFKTYTF